MNSTSDKTSRFTEELLEKIKGFDNELERIVEFELDGLVLVYSDLLITMQKLFAIRGKIVGIDYDTWERTNDIISDLTKISNAIREMIGAVANNYYELLTMLIEIKDKVKNLYKETQQKL